MPKKKASKLTVTYIGYPGNGHAVINFGGGKIPSTTQLRKALIGKKSQFFPLPSINEVSAYCEANKEELRFPLYFMVSEGLIVQMTESLDNVEPLFIQFSNIIKEICLLRKVKK